MWIAGLILVVVGVALYWTATAANDKANYMQATETSNVGDVISLIEEVRADMGGIGSSGYADAHELKGHVACDKPLIGEFSGTPGAIVNTRVEREIETLEEYEDSEGNLLTRWVRSSHTMSSNRQETVFFIDDGTGRMRVDPTSSHLDLIAVVNRFEQPQAVEHAAGSGQATISISGFSLSVPAQADAHDRRTLGYRFIEEALPIGQSLYVYGEIADTDDDGLVVRKPSDSSGRPYVLSTRGEEALVKAAQDSAAFRKWAGVAMAVGGAALTVVGFLR